jgi:hypothetical protein
MAKKKDNLECIGVVVDESQLSQLADVVILYSFCNCGGEGHHAIGIGDWEECKDRMKWIIKR